MDRTLAEFAASGAPTAERLRVARELAAVAADLAARGKVHGGLAPDAVVVLDGGAVVLRPAAGAGTRARAGFDAPEVARGGRPTPRADAFSVGALAWLALAGRPPFQAEEPLEAVRRVLHAEPPPVRLHAPAVPLEVDGAIATLLEKRASRRGGVSGLVRAIDGAIAAIPTSTPTATATSTSTSTATATATSTPTPTATPTPVLPLLQAAPGGGGWREGASRLARACDASARSLAAALARALAAARALPPLPRTALAAVPLVALSLALLPRTDSALARDVARLIERGDVSAARARLDEAAARRSGSPVLEKLRGDVACARGAAGECLRRYRVAIAAREELREDPALRANARRLLDRGHSCGTRRAAAQLLGELRDPEALPALEEARRSGGIFAALCTGDAVDRAIAATRAELAR